MLPEISPKDRFEAWLNELDEICLDELGKSFRDFPDQTYRKWFNEGYSTEDSFNELAENCHVGVEFENIHIPINSTYTQEYDSYSDADPGL